jgi:hypothetical protein
LIWVTAPLHTTKYAKVLALGNAVLRRRRNANEENKVEFGGVFTPCFDKNKIQILRPKSIC